MTDYTIERIELPTPLAVGPVNAYLISSDEGYVLVDCGLKHPATERRLMEALSAHGLQPGDLSAVVLTHGHVDHVGLAALFRKAGVPVLAPPGVDLWLDVGGPWDQYRADFFLHLYRSMGVPEERIAKSMEELSFLSRWTDRSVVDEVISYGDELSRLPGFTAIHVPGHAQHALALWNETTGDFISGDQLLPHISSNAIIEPEMHAASGDKAQRTRSLLQYRENLQFLKTLPMGKTYPGHGEVFEGAHALIEKRLKGMRRRQEQFSELIPASGAVTTFELATTYFPKHAHELQLILSETLGYLDWLAEEGRIEEVVDDDGKRFWQSVGSRRSAVRTSR